MIEYTPYLVALLAGVAYGFIFGLIPIAGATVALITIFSFVGVFNSDPYTLVVFSTAVVVSCSIGDLFASIIMNIPGGGGSAASMVDGFPMAKKGEAARALSAAVFTSSFNGIIWGILVFAFLPLYGNVIFKFGIPEMLAFLCMAFASAAFMTSSYWFRGIIALILGILVGMIGMDPVSGYARGTFGWEYIKAGIQMIPVMAGLMAMPELIETYKTGKIQSIAIIGNVRAQVVQGFRDAKLYVWDGVRGGFIGAFIGLLPGVGGAVVDWLSYGSTVANNPNDKIAFGDGNVRGVVGSEGANMAQKSTSYVPTVLFGVPGAPFEVIVMGLLAIVGFDLGTPALMEDHKFFDLLNYSFMLSVGATFIISLALIKFTPLITKIPFKIYFWMLVIIISWSSAQYTGYWEDYAMLTICTAVGVSFKYLKFSRAAFVIGFILSSRFESLLLQYNTLYSPIDIITRPISAVLMVCALVIITYGIFFNKSRINYV